MAQGNIDGLCQNNIFHEIIICGRSRCCVHTGCLWQQSLWERTGTITQSLFWMGRNLGQQHSLYDPTSLKCYHCFHSRYPIWKKQSYHNRFFLTEYGWASDGCLLFKAIQKATCFDLWESWEHMNWLLFYIIFKDSIPQHKISNLTLYQCDSSGKLKAKSVQKTFNVLFSTKNQ